MKFLLVELGKLNKKYLVVSDEGWLEFRGREFKILGEFHYGELVKLIREGKAKRISKGIWVIQKEGA